LLEAVVSSDDPSLQVHRGEARYMLGLAKFRSGAFEQAALQLEAALQEEEPAYAADAAYMRFKALEALVAENWDANVGPRYEAAVREFLEAHAEHPAAYEARFRLGELLQAQSRFGEAIEEYAKVQGDPGVKVQAEFGALQCRFELLRGDTLGDNRDARVEKIGEALQRFDTGAQELQKSGEMADDVPLEQMRAKAAIMRAVYVKLLPDPDNEKVLGALADFETRYPGQEDLLPQVVRLRLTAYRELGRFADAGREVEERGEILVASLDAAAVEEIAVAFVREGARRAQAEGAEANRAAQQVAVRLYQQLAAGDEADGRTALTMARLYENIGDLDRAESLYAEMLGPERVSATALRGLGRIAEKRGRLSDARGYWQRLLEAARPGDLPWYEAHYQVARLTDAMGNASESCEQLQELRPAMPGLSDANLRADLSRLYEQVCR
jgi:tetratricopeptide (TPR) repeat protein